MEILIKNGAEINAKTAQGNTPLHTNAANGIENLNSNLDSCVVSSMNFDTNYHYHHLGRADVVKLLVQKGADINIKNENSKTALELAFEYGKFKKKITLHCFYG